jgi:hypothetical protein
MSREVDETAQMEVFAGMLRHLCWRSKMYTFDGSFREVVIYIEAYIQGSGFPRGQINLESGMEPFGRWLARRFGYNECRRWHRILVEHCGGDEDQALQQLWPLYEEYLGVNE